jgi:hypothetical protein
MEHTEIFEAPEYIADKLSLLTFEMVDPEQDLSVQQPGCGATTFTCFPKLIPELRLMIWRAAFPRGRIVKIESQLKDYIYYGHPLPSNLMNNQESRKETLRHYLLYCQDDELFRRLRGWSHLRSPRDLQQQPRPICYSPGRDLLFVPYIPPTESSTNALLELVAEKCKPIGKVRVLATDYFSYFTKWRGVIPNSKPFGFTIFHDLKEICYINDPRISEWHKSDALEAIYKAFDLEREESPCLSIPKISFFRSLQDWEKSMQAQGW